MLEQQKQNIKAQKFRREHWNHIAQDLKLELPKDLVHAIQLAEEKGAPSWLSSMPIHEHGFSLHKGAFRDMHSPSDTDGPL